MVGAGRQVVGGGWWGGGAVLGLNGGLAASCWGWKGLLLHTCSLLLQRGSFPPQASSPAVPAVQHGQAGPVCCGALWQQQCGCPWQAAGQLRQPRHGGDGGGWHRAGSVRAGCCYFCAVFMLLLQESWGLSVPASPGRLGVRTLQQLQCLFPRMPCRRLAAAWQAGAGPGACPSPSRPSRSPRGELPCWAATAEWQQQPAVSVAWGRVRRTVL